MSGNRFSGRAVLVTGAGTGIGRAVALGFAAEGARVVVAGRSRAPLEETVSLVERAAERLRPRSPTSAAPTRRKGWWTPSSDGTARSMSP
ncbi:hypothetical protein GCM10020256_69420 [Streptomyces thermocoprophilus]